MTAPAETQARTGGLIDDGERLDGAAARILEEQTGLRHVYLKQLYSFDDEARDPSGRVVSIAYFSLVQRDGLELRTTDKYRQVRFWNSDGLPGKLAYDHETILDYARARLTAKIQYTNVMWSLLPEKFTLSQLQAAYETVLSHSVITTATPHRSSGAPAGRNGWFGGEVCSGAPIAEPVPRTAPGHGRD